MQIMAAICSELERGGERKGDRKDERESNALLHFPSKGHLAIACILNKKILLSWFVIKPLYIRY